MAQGNPNPSPETRFKEGHQTALKHGGAGAVKAITEGRAFQGLAAQAERDVIHDLQESGRQFLVEEIATRAHTALRLYWAAVQKAADAGDLEKLDNYCKRFGWLAGVASRAWREVREEEKVSGKAGALDYEELVKNLEQGND